MMHAHNVVQASFYYKQHVIDNVIWVVIGQILQQVHVNLVPQVAHNVLVAMIHNVLNVKLAYFFILTNVSAYAPLAFGLVLLIVFVMHVIKAVLLGNL